MTSQDSALVPDPVMRSQLRLHRGRHGLVVAEHDGVAALATRQVARTARLYQQTRQPVGSVRIALAMGCIAMGAVAFRLHDACIRAAVALSSVLS